MSLAHARRLAPLAVLAVAALALFGYPATADHTDPSTPLAPTDGPPAEGLPQGDGTWEFIKNFPANPGSDLRFFTVGDELYATSGTLGQADQQHVGQRIIRLIDADGNVDPTWVADHGSANCPTANPAGTLGLQHDVQTVPRHDVLTDEDPVQVELIVDATDATGRCHDPEGGGMEFLDASGIGTTDGAPLREIHLTRIDGTTHNQTVDATRPWIVYNSNSDSGRPWIDVTDIRTCLTAAAGGSLPAGASLEDKREACRPLVYRLPFEPSWTAQKVPSTGMVQNPYGCHDITVSPNRLYCAAIFGTAIFDVSGLTDASGAVRGEPLPCTVTDGTLTAAKVTDCRVSGANQAANLDQISYGELEDAGGTGSPPQVKGFEFLGHVNHPGAQGAAGPAPTANNNPHVPSAEGVAISHESDPSPDGRFMFVTDERGGGVVPPGSTCAPGLDNPIGNGGMHVFDISNPAAPTYALTPDDSKAVFISEAVVPGPTFCNIHVIEQIPDEQRIVMAWYDQGVRIVDYDIDANGRWTFTEVGSYTLPSANTWTVEAFRIEDNDDGTRTYYLMASDIQRGIDVYSFTAEPGPPLEDTPADAPPAVDVNVAERAAGDDRIETAIELSTHGFPGENPSVILAKAGDFPDALSAAGLAAALPAPILLTGSDALDDRVKVELARLLPETVYLIGGESALGPAIAEELTQLQMEVVRLSGGDRFGTAAAVMDEVVAVKGAVTRATVALGVRASGDAWPDALAAGNLANAGGAPILLTAPDHLPEATTEALDRNLAEAGDDSDNPTNTVYVVGGTSAITPSVQSALEEQGSTRGYAVRRLSGPDRYSTAVAVIQEARRLGLDITALALASGRNFPDALAAAPAARALVHPPNFPGGLLLVDPEDLAGSPATRDFLARSPERINRLLIAGGRQAVAPEVMASAQALITAER